MTKVRLKMLYCPRCGEKTKHKKSLDWTPNLRYVRPFQAFLTGKQYKQLSCQDFGVDCAFLVRAESEEEVLRVGFDHACKVHGKCERSPEMESKARSLIQISLYKTQR